MHINEARELVPEFKATNTILKRQRRRLLRFISDYQGYLLGSGYRDKAARGYLRDLDNAQVVCAVQQILKEHKRQEEGGE